MAHSQWHRLYTSKVAASPELLFGLLSDMPNYDRWLPQSGQFARTTDVEPYPVQLGSRYHDGKPGEPGKDWRGSVTGFQPPAPQVAEWAGHSVDVLLRVYAKCISGQQYEAKRRIEEATMPREDEYVPWTSR